MVLSLGERISISREARRYEEEKMWTVVSAVNEYILPFISNSNTARTSIAVLMFVLFRSTATQKVKGKHAPA